jgi:hypothetical protein
MFRLVMEKYQCKWWESFLCASILNNCDWFYFSNVFFRSDYVFDNLKFGGNAQSITKNRWIHHTSFLWDYDTRNMEYLKHPSRTPKYRLVCAICFNVKFYWSCIMHLSIHASCILVPLFNLISKIKATRKKTLIVIEYTEKLNGEWFLLWLQERSHVEFLRRMKDFIPSKSIFIERTLKSLQKHFVLQPINPDDIYALHSPYAPSSRLLTKQELEQELLSSGSWSKLYFARSIYFILFVFRRLLSCPDGWGVINANNYFFPSSRNV